MSTRAEPPEAAVRLLPNELCTAVERLGIAVALISLDGEWLLPGQQLCAMSGFSRAELLGQPCSNFLCATPLQDPDYQRLLSGEISTYFKECKAVCKNGSTLFVNAAFSLVSDPATNRPDHLVAVIEDVTERKQSEQARLNVADRLVRAQEAERTRIARELHGDIGQSLAILRVQMMRAGKPVSDVPRKVHPSIIDLSSKVMEIANKVSQISHQLHSSHLEYLGLKAAVESACREFGEQYHANVDCICEETTAKVDGITGLCFLRVLQEALHNISTHSGAENVEVRLKQSGEELLLVVIDDGKGFDPEEARLTAGLGLISMRERVNLVGGRFDITSAPDEGTRIRALAPITPPKKSFTADSSR